MTTMGVVKYPLLHDEDWVRERVDAGMSGAAIARELGCHESNVWLALKRYGIVRPPKLDVPNNRRYGAGNVKYPKLQDAEWLRKVYVEEGRSCIDIADEIGCSNSTVSSALVRCGIEMRSRRRGKARSKTLKPTQFAETCKCERPSPTSDGCMKCGKPLRVELAAVAPITDADREAWAAEEWNDEPEQARRSQIMREVNARRKGLAAGPLSLSWREEQVLWFHNRGATDKEIALKLNISRTTVATHLHKARKKLTPALEEAA